MQIQILYFYKCRCRWGINTEVDTNENTVKMQTNIPHANAQRTNILLYTKKRKHKHTKAPTAKVDIVTRGPMGQM